MSVLPLVLIAASAAVVALLIPIAVAAVMRRRKRSSAKGGDDRLRFALAKDRADHFTDRHGNVLWDTEGADATAPKALNAALVDDDDDGDDADEPAAR